MTEKFGLIKNPLTIIAIFAGIAEVSGTTVLPFISATNQQLFIYFLIFFPCLLVVLFFATLNFNNKVLYAPSDYKNEELFVRVMRYDFKKMQNVEERLLSITDSSEMQLSRPSLPKSRRSAPVPLPQFSGRESQASRNPNHISILIDSFSDANHLITLLGKKGYFADLDDSFGRVMKKEGFESIWLGKNVPPVHAKTIIKISQNFYPHLIYISISGEQGRTVPDFVHNQIYIGGASQTAIDDKCKPLTPDEFRRIQTIDDNEFHDFIRGFSNQYS